MGSKESITGLKSDLSFADFLGYNIGSTKGNSSSNAFLKIYEDEMKATGISSIEEYLKQNKESIKQSIRAGEFEHKKYQPGKQLLSDMADIASFGVLPLIKAISGYDIITQEKLSETERAFAAVDAFLGFLAIGKLVSAGGKTASKIAGAYATDAASVLAGRAAGEIGEELGLPGWANIGLALFVGVKVSNGVSKMCLNMGGLDIELANDQLARIIKNTDNPKELGKLVENLDEAGLKEVVKELDKTDTKRLQELLDDGTWKKVEAAIGGNGVGGIDDIITNGSHYVDGKLKPNSTYKTGEHDYIYKTNQDGLVSNAQTDDLKLKTHDGRLKHNAKTPGKMDGDHAGHLFGDRFGGSPELDNLVSQAKEVNLGKYKVIENDWADALKEGKSISVTISIDYAKGTSRPISFSVSYTIDGEDFFEFITN